MLEFLTNHRHEWKLLSKNAINHQYGCVRCSKTVKVKNDDVAMWKFKRERKGDWFTS